MERARRIAVVGAGPSGLFAAQALVAQTEVPVHVDLIDRLPAPYGLLRYGVAPDHTSIKSVATALARTFDNEGIRFLGNVEVGTDTTREELLAAYDAVVYAVGATEDLRMGVPGEDLPGSGSAREFVAWYSGHPDAAPQSLAEVSAAATIGVGNVAVDVARILAKEASALEETDMPEAVLAELHRADVRDIWVVGRRGPQYAAFTTVELRELVHTPGIAVTVNDDAFEGIDESALDRRAKANVQILREVAATEVTAPRRTVHFLFWRRPYAVEGTDRVSGLVLERTRLDQTGRVVGTGETEPIVVQLVLRSIGYRSVPLADLPFDPARSVVANVEGRVVEATGAVCPREYAVGWFKRGPVGVIGTNKSCAAQTVRHLVADLAAAPAAPEPAVDLVGALTDRGHPPTTWAGWQAIDAAEVARGAALGRARTKLATWPELLEAATTSR
jgi:ferredoxin--NADP+ reductase